MKKKAFGRAIKSIREQHGKSQSELAEAMCVTQQTVSSWECGTTYPDVEAIEKICEILEIREDELFEEGRRYERLEGTLSSNKILMRVIGIVLVGGIAAAIAASLFGPKPTPGGVTTPTASTTTSETEEESTPPATTEAEPAETSAPEQTQEHTTPAPQYTAEGWRILGKWEVITYSLAGREISLYYEGRRPICAYGDITAEITESADHVYISEPTDYDGDGEPELAVRCESGARGNETLFILDDTGNEELTIAECGDTLPEYTCYLLENNKAKIVYNDTGKVVEVPVTSSSAHYFWDENGAFVQNEYYHPDEEGRYQIRSWYQESDIRILEEEGQYTFTRSTAMTLGSGAELLILYIEQYRYDGKSFERFEDSYGWLSFESFSAS